MDNESIVGQEIVKVRGLTDDELEANGWDRCSDQGAAVLELANGALVYPSCDPEGNSPGFLFGNAPDGESIYVMAPRKDI